MSEPRFSTPCEMRFFPREKGKTAISKKKPSTQAVFPEVENRGSLISVPLALRELIAVLSESVLDQNGPNDHFGQMTLFRTRF